MGHGDLENAARFPDLHTPDDHYGIFSKRRYTNIPLGTKDRSGHDYEGGPAVSMAAPALLCNCSGGWTVHRDIYWALARTVLATSVRGPIDVHKVYLVEA